jgi:hypothetical protein
VRVSARPASLRCRLDLERDEAVPLTLSVSTGAARLINIESVPTPP